MNPLTNMKNVLKLSEQELHTGNKTSWHDQYKDSAWIFVGGFLYDLTEGDIMSVFSQYGEIVHINLIRDKDTGKSKGFCFICYEDQRSTVLAVDNLNGIKLLNRILRVDHVSNYKVPKHVKQEADKVLSQNVEVKPVIKNEPIVEPYEDVRETLADQITGQIKLPPRLPIYVIKEEPGEKVIKTEKVKKKKEKKSKKEKKHKKKSKKRKKASSESSNNDDSSSDNEEGRTRKHENKESDYHKKIRK